jgi:hypothetical protein
MALKRKLHKNDYTESFRFNEGKDFFRDNKRHLQKLDLAASNYQQYVNNHKLAYP